MSAPENTSQSLERETIERRAREMFEAMQRDFPEAAKTTWDKVTESDMIADIELRQQFVLVARFSIQKETEAFKAGIELGQALERAGETPE